VVNIRGKSPLPLIGHTAFFRDKKVFVFGGVKKIEDKDNPQELILFYLDVVNLEHAEWYQVFIGPTIKMLSCYLVNQQEYFFGSGCKNP